jgi:Protein of unknown function (DUF3800)
LVHGRKERSPANIPVELILEDPVFKVSQRSYFIQLADFCAYALLRKERPLASKTKYGLDTAFELLNPVLLTQATRYDPQGSFDPCGAKLIKKQGLPSPRTRIERLRARGLGPCEHSFVASVARPTAVSAERSRTAFGSEAPLGAARASLAPERTSPLRRRSPSSRPEASWRRSRRR